MLTNRRSTMMMAPNPNLTRPQTLHLPSPESEPHSRNPSILTSTTPDLPGYRITRVLGTVDGLTTCARKDTKSFLKSVGIGSEAKSLTHMLYNARHQAVERMVRDCVARGGNAVIGMGYNESEVLGFATISCYGTAVFVERVREKEDPFA
ncbi:putative heavy-metal-binding-domain-containing protein [Dendryphion nanum]|uniref:Heavy-metal-binding-domain-containing protein n=1 Tax=Dendryphion nanum TaxID=256645 RepID=A0A9P9EC49_9PLEO|nr:putative heavy-metal-binding-domain-containing protein [Dendryphion nanum]